MTPEKYLDLKKAIIDRGYEPDITWAENVKPCASSDDFLIEFVFVVCNSGMKAQIARQIFNRLIEAMRSRTSIREVFGHEGKLGAIGYVWVIRNRLFTEYLSAKNKIEFCKSLPWIGDITKYHLAKNLGVDCIKPDRHLERIAKTYNTDPFSMCKKLSERLGDTLNTVDTVIRRAANQGLI